MLRTKNSRAEAEVSVGYTVVGENAIRVEQRVDAPLEAIWEACTQPADIARWQADAAHGAVVEGGRLRLSWPSLNVRIALDIVEVVKHRRIVMKSGASLVELEFEEGGIKLTHRGLTAGDEADGTASSWRLALAQLAHYLGRHRGRRRRVHWALRPVSIEPSSAHAFFTEPLALSAWLTQPGCTTDAIGAPGSRFRTTLFWGQAMSGQVLSNTPGRDIALSWEEEGDSVVSLRTVPAPNGARERLLLLTWSRWREPQGTPPSDAREHLAGFERALFRLARLVESAGQA